jgi:hypothetical protein
MNLIPRSPSDIFLNTQYIPPEVVGRKLSHIFSKITTGAVR